MNVDGHRTFSQQGMYGVAEVKVPTFGGHHVGNMPAVFPHVLRRGEERIRVAKSLLRLDDGPLAAQQLLGEARQDGPLLLTFLVAENSRPVVVRNERRGLHVDAVPGPGALQGDAGKTVHVLVADEQNVPPLPKCEHPLLEHASQGGFVEERVSQAADVRADVFEALPDLPQFLGRRVVEPSVVGEHREGGQLGRKILQPPAEILKSGKAFFPLRYHPPHLHGEAEEVPHQNKLLPGEKGRGLRLFEEG